MGCRFSKEFQARKKSKLIDKKLENEKMNLHRNLKLLLLGAGESGKSTIVKQMKIIHNDGYSEEELKAFRFVVFENLVQSILVILTWLRDKSIPLTHSMSHANAYLVMSISNVDQWLRNIFHDGFDENEMNDKQIPTLTDILDACSALVKDESIKSAIERSSEFQLNDSAKYFFENIDRIRDPNYLPTYDDVLRTRTRTSGICETIFNYENFTFTLCDVGGQRSERRKWIQCFENVSAVIFVVALSEYDQCLREDETVNRMHDSITLFKSISHTSCFRSSDIILFLNKTDLFREKLARCPIKVCFPDYEGSNDYDQSSVYIKDVFTSSAKEDESDKENSTEFYTHFTCATDTKSLQNVFVTVADLIIKRNLKQCKLF